MKLTFLLGPAGSGKTAYCLQAIGEELLRSQEGPPLVFLVPEQMTFQVERAMLKMVPGFMRLHVLSFRRLAWRILEQTGGHRTPFITETGRAMVVQSILNRHAGELTVFKPLPGNPGLARAIARAVREMMAWNVSVEDVRAASDGASQGQDELFAHKIRDVALVYDEYRKFLAGRFTDPDDYLALAAANLARSFVRGSRVWIDGFSGFTPREYDVLASLFRVAQEVTVALCMDPAELLKPPDETRIFYPTRRVLEKLREIAARTGVQTVSALALPRGGPVECGPDCDELLRTTDLLRVEEVPPRFAGSSELVKLEAGLRSLDYPVRIPEDGRGQEEGTVPDCRGSGDVIIVRASNPRAEVESCAREILRLVREEGYRFREMTVEVRDLSGGAGVPYGELIRTIFADYGIPFFLDERRPVTHHPVVGLIRAALDVLVTKWSSDAVLSYLKNDLAGVDRSEVDVIENFVLARGIRGPSWLSEDLWGDLAASKDRAIRELRAFVESVEAAPAGLTSGVLCSAVLELLRSLDVPGTLERWRRQALEQGNPEEAMYHSGTWEATLKLLDEVHEILGDQPITPEEYASVVTAGFEDLRVGLIPPGLDQVQVSSLERSRQPDPRVTFLLGAYQGLFPRRHEDDTVFSDAEREKLANLGIEMDASSRTRQFLERYLTYIALTRPSCRLWISYPASDSEGRAVVPSSVIADIKRLFPEKTERYEGPDPPDQVEEALDWVVPGRVLGTLAGQLSRVRQGRPCGRLWVEVYRWMLSGPFRGKALSVLRALGHSNHPGSLSRETAMRLYGNPLVSSVSSLEGYSRCPFYHFAADGLRLEEREMFVVEPATAGSLLHFALKELVEKVAEKGIEWGELSPELVSDLAGEAFETVLASPEVQIFRSSPRYRYVADVLKRAFLKASLAVAEQVRSGRFRPAAAELGFGFSDGPAALEFSLGDGVVLKLRGIIDRVDVAEDEGGRYVRVVDYKSGATDLRLEDVIHGLALQLPVYLMAAVRWLESAGEPSAVPERSDPGHARSKPVVPAGALYFRVILPVESTKGPPDPPGDMIPRFRMRGMVSGSDTVLRLMEPDRGTGSSRFLPVRYLRSGEAKGPVYSDDEIRGLLKLVERKLCELGRSLIEGDISIAPYRRGTERACKYCPYGPLCSFDILVPGNTYRNLRRISREEASRLLAEAAGTREETS